jgi:hypothetical protein
VAKDSFLYLTFSSIMDYYDGRLQDASHCGRKGATGSLKMSGRKKALSARTNRLLLTKVRTHPSNDRVLLLNSVVVPYETGGSWRDAGAGYVDNRVDRKAAR